MPSKPNLPTLHNHNQPNVNVSFILIPTPFRSRMLSSLASFSRAAVCNRFISRINHALSLSQSAPRLTQQCMRANNNLRTQTVINSFTCRLFSARRRRRGLPSSVAEQTPTDSAPASSANFSNQQFLPMANQLLNQIELSISKLQDCNDGLRIERHASFTDKDSQNVDERDASHEGQLLIHVAPSGDTFWGGGTYKLTIHSDPIDGRNKIYNGYISLQSPLSGTFTYGLGRTGEWESTEDGHALLGMFTRDFIRQCHGVPDL